MVVAIGKATNCPISTATAFNASPQGFGDSTEKSDGYANVPGSKAEPRNVDDPEQ